MWVLYVTVRKQLSSKNKFSDIKAAGRRQDIMVGQLDDEFGEGSGDEGALASGARRGQAAVKKSTRWADTIIVTWE